MAAPCKRHVVNDATRSLRVWTGCMGEGISEGRALAQLALQQHGGGPELGEVAQRERRPLLALPRHVQRAPLLAATQQGLLALPGAGLLRRGVEL